MEDIRRYLSPQRAAPVSTRSQPNSAAPEPSRAPQAPVRGEPHAAPQERRVGRNRRIIESDDDMLIFVDADNVIDDAGQVRQPAAPNVGDLNIVSSDSEDVRASPQHTPSVRRIAPPLPVQQQPSRRAAQTNRAASTAPITASRRRGGDNQRTPPRQRRRYDVEAEESSATNHDSSSSCIESDPNAQDLYRSAIMGVRNARQARQQQRSRTTHCSVCSRFAAFLENFI